MKKSIILIMVILFAFTLVSCGSDTSNELPSASPVPTAKPTPTPTPEPTPNPELTDSLESIIKKMHAAISAELAEHVAFQEISDDMKTYFLGTDKIEFTEALAAEPMIGVMPHSIVLIRVAEGIDVAATVNLIKENADPRKWICVGVEPDKLLVENIGHTIALVIDENSEDIMEIFRNLKPE